jgi:hypothetical protein
MCNRIRISARGTISYLAALFTSFLAPVEIYQDRFAAESWTKGRETILPLKSQQPAYFGKLAAEYKIRIRKGEGRNVQVGQDRVQIGSGDEVGSTLQTTAGPAIPDTFSPTDFNSP